MSQESEALPVACALHLKCPRAREVRSAKRDFRRHRRSERRSTATSEEATQRAPQRGRTIFRSDHLHRREPRSTSAKLRWISATGCREQGRSFAGTARALRDRRGRRSTNGQPGHIPHSAVMAVRVGAPRRNQGLKINLDDFRSPTPGGRRQYALTCSAPSRPLCGGRARKKKLTPTSSVKLRASPSKLSFGIQDNDHAQPRAG